MHEEQARALAVDLSKLTGAATPEQIAVMLDSGRPIGPLYIGSDGHWRDRERTVGAVDVDFCGVEHEQCFDKGGCGTYDGFAIGIGEDAEEAYNDALEQLHSAGEWNTFSPLFDLAVGDEFRGRIGRPTVERALGEAGHSDDCEDDCDHDTESLHFYVVIRVREATQHVTVDSGNTDELFRIELGENAIYVWSDHLENALEAAIDYAVDREWWGVFTVVGEAELREAAEDMGVDFPPFDTIDHNDPAWLAIIEHAEQDLMVIGHTSFEVPGHPGSPYIASDEWAGREADISELCE